MKQLTTLVFLVSSLLLSQSLAATTLPTPTPPPVSARSYIVMDYNSGKVLAEKKADKRVEPASITKLMTAYVLFTEIKANRIQLSDQVLISKRARRMTGSRSFIEAGSRVSVDDLLRGMIIQSGNDATVALAEHAAGSEETFVSLMNQHAAHLGMAGSNFVNSTGLPGKQHYSTARDIAVLARALIHEFPEFYPLYSEKKFTYNNITQHNRNLLLWRDDSVDGLKTGHTQSAGYCLVSSALRDNMRLITVVLGDKSENKRAVSSLALLNYGFRFFETRKLYAAGQTLKQIRVWKGDREQLPVGLNSDLYLTLPRGSFKSLKVSVKLPSQQMAPVSKGQSLGTLNVSRDTLVMAEQPLIALSSVNEGGLWTRITDSVLLWFE